jgi:metallophosphoesterase (TIGR00282 family)
MNILFIGDIVGRPGRAAVERWLPELREELAVDVVVANAENSAGGLGATPDILRELIALGVHAFTMGNHTWRKKELAPAIDKFPNLVRPANYPPGVPGRGAALIALPDGRRLGLVQLLGRVFMEPFEDPFLTGEREVDWLRQSTPIILVDMHAEATSEKQALGWFLDGRCTAVVGTHTHVATADETILPGGTAYITDVGMTGPLESVIGTDRDIVIKKFVTGMPATFEVARGRPALNGVLVEADDETGRATGIRRIHRAVG